MDKLSHGCTLDCADCCKFNVYVEDNKIIKIEGDKDHPYTKGFICKNYNECKFGIWKNDKFLEYYKKKPNKTMVKSILKNGSAKVKSLTSKQGNKFDTTLRYSKKDNGYFGWDLEI